MKKPSQLRAYLTFAWYSFRAQTRNPSTFAFGFIFPIVFISIFGLIGNSTPKIALGIPPQPENVIVKTLEKQSFVTVDKEDKTNLEAKLKQGKIAGIVTVDQELNTTVPHYNVKIITSSASPQNAATVKSLVQGIVDQANLKLSGVTTPPISLTNQEISGRATRYIDFALPGQIGFSLLSTAIFGTVFGFIYLKKSLVLKRIFSTPTHPLTILLSQGTSRLIVAILQTLLILGVGVLVFHFYLIHGWTTFFELIALSAIGLIAFLGFGYFMAGLANDENSAGPLVNLITLPQFLLSGTFFSTDSLPSWVQPIANNLPLSYFNIAMRKVTSEGLSLFEVWPYLLGLILWGTVMYLLAAKTFKWE